MTSRPMPTGLFDKLRVLLVCLFFGGFFELNMLLYFFLSTPRRQQREERGCYRTLLDELITTDIPGYRNFTRMEPAFFDLIEERITPHLRKSETNFRKPLEVGLKLAVTLRHFATEESYTSLQYHWRVGRTTRVKFVPKVCQAILREFQKEYLICPSGNHRQ